jgi:hypothetical protein
MIKRVLGEWVSYVGIYNVYINVVSIIQTWELELTFDTNLVPFFLILATINTAIEINELKAPTLVVDNRSKAK